MFVVFTMSYYLFFLVKGKRRKRSDDEDELDDRLEDDDYDLIEENLGVKVKRTVNFYFSIKPLIFLALTNNVCPYFISFFKYRNDSNV